VSVRSATSVPGPEVTGKVNGVKGSLLKLLFPRFVSNLVSFLLVPNIRACIPLVQYRPSHRRYHNAAGELDNRQRDSKEVENGCAQKFNDGQKDDVNQLRSCAPETDRRLAVLRREPKEHESRPKRIDQAVRAH